MAFAKLASLGRPDFDFVTDIKHVITDPLNIGRAHHDHHLNGSLVIPRPIAQPLPATFGSFVPSIKKPLCQKHLGFTELGLGGMPIGKKQDGIFSLGNYTNEDRAKAGKRARDIGGILTVIGKATEQPELVAVGVGLTVEGGILQASADKTVKPPLEEAGLLFGTVVGGEEGGKIGGKVGKFASKLYGSGLIGKSDKHRPKVRTTGLQQPEDRPKITDIEQPHIGHGFTEDRPKITDIEQPHIGHGFTEDRPKITDIKQPHVLIIPEGESSYGFNDEHHIPKDNNIGHHENVTEKDDEGTNNISHIKNMEQQIMDREAENTLRQLYGLAGEIENGFQLLDRLGLNSGGQQAIEAHQPNQNLDNFF